MPMIYPRDVIQEISDKNEKFKITELDFSTYNSINFSEQSAPIIENNQLEKFMIEDGYNNLISMRRYVFFLSSMYDVFERIYDYFPKINHNTTHKDDHSAIGTAPFELFYHAMYIYYLSSYNIPGNVIECGSFKGFSSCCLSWVCNFLGKRLYVADSFAGLPDNTTDPYYKKGDFCGSFDEVAQNIKTFGRPESVSFIKGFFSDSLRDFDDKLCMIWMDVDLYESATDVLENLYEKLSPGGVIMSHELFKDRDFEGNQLKPTIGPSKALFDYFHKNNITYQAMPLENGTGLIVPNSNGKKLSMSLSNAIYLRDHCRKNVTFFQNQIAAVHREMSAIPQREEALSLRSQIIKKIFGQIRR